MELSFTDLSLDQLIALSFLAIFAVMFFFLWLGWVYSKRKKVVLSPYTKKPVRRFDTSSYISIVKVTDYLETLSQYDNRMFNIHRAVVCRDTGRIFQDVITWYGKMQLDWSFLQKRFPGQYVSWGSLSDGLKEDFYKVHDNMEEFQTKLSSPSPLPRNIEPEYVYSKPGPLYANLETKELLGWKCIPDSELEVLIIQKPKDTSGLPMYLREEKAIEVALKKWIEEVQKKKEEK